MKDFKIILKIYTWSQDLLMTTPFSLNLLFLRVPPCNLYLSRFEWYVITRIVILDVIIQMGFQKHKRFIFTA